MSESPLKCRNVFLDTEVYDHQKFRFDHAALKKLRELGSAGFLHILTTYVVDGEVRRHITANLNNAFVAMSRFQSHAGILQETPPQEYQPLFKQIDQAHLKQSGIHAWEKFLADAKVETIPSLDVQATELLNLYFAQRPPFSDKKKSEFPDAISLISIEKWCQKKGAQTYLIGDDPDTRAWCDQHPGVHHVTSITEFLDLYNRAEETLTQLALAIFEKEQKWIDSVVRESFLECSFVYADNWEAEVENVEVTSTRVDDVNVIQVDEHSFILSLAMEIRFTADASGPDFDRGSWDSEDNRYAYLPYFHTKLASTETYEVSFEVMYDISKEEATEIKEVLFDDANEIRVQDELGWPYK